MQVITNKDSKVLEDSKTYLHVYDISNAALVQQLVQV